MSGICGLARLDAGNASAEHLAAMLPRLERRGPQATRLHSEAGVALGHTLLATTPEAEVEILPLTEPASGCTITADARIDNREDLLPALGLADAGRVVGDGEVILAAYLRWGHDCCTHLVGDFAFAIHDPRDRTLFCARDRAGMRPLIWTHAPGSIFAFASDVEALVSCGDVPARLNEGRVADFLMGLEDADFTTTFYEDVFRLPPAHQLVLCDGTVKVTRYWQLCRPAPLILPNEDAYAEAFRTVYETALRARLRAPAGRIGAMLSGGMDSGSNVALASRILAAERRGPLPTFSGVGPTEPECAELAAIRTMQALPDVEPHEVDLGQIDEWIEPLLALKAQMGEPFDWSHDMHRAICIAARDQGMRVLLDGIAGDLAFNEGPHVAQLLRSGRFMAAWQAISARCAIYALPEWRKRMLAEGLYVAFLPEALRSRIRRWRDRRHQPKCPPGFVIDPDFAQRTQISRRLERSAPRTAPVRDLGESRSRVALSTILINARESFDRDAGLCGIELRDPFMDIRLIEFCLSVPAEWMIRQGWIKYLQRIAMSGIVPDAVRWNLAKVHFGAAFTAAVRARSAPQPLTFGTVSHGLFRQIRRRVAPHKFVDSVLDHDLKSLLDWIDCPSRAYLEKIDGEARNS